MKPTNLHNQSLQARLFLTCSMSLGLVAAGWPGQAMAEAVDTELVLLVDVTSSALNNKDFTQLMDGYATAFSSTQIMDSIQSGASKRITAISTTSVLDNTFAVTLTSSLGQTIQASADSSITAVPEPGRMLALVTGIIFLLKRRRL